MPVSGGPTSLVTLDDAKAHLNIDPTDTTYDAELQGFIDAATAFVQFETGPILYQAFTEVHSGGGPTIVLDNPPIIAVDTVIEYVGPTAYTLTQAELGATTGQYSWSLDDANAGIIARRYSGGFVGNFAAGYRNVYVSYTAGRTSVPADVRMATLEDLRGLWTQTQYARPSAQFGSGIGGQADNWTETPMNPIGTFPRLTALLQGPSRTPSIA